MSRTPARITQADVARAIRAAQQCGAGKVRIERDGTITIDPRPTEDRPRTDLASLEPEADIVL